jgi:hypothetical protein
LQSFAVSCSYTPSLTSRVYCRARSVRVLAPRTVVVSARTGTRLQDPQFNCLWRVASARMWRESLRSDEELACNITSTPCRMSLYLQKPHLDCLCNCKDLECNCFGQVVRRAGGGDLASLGGGDFACNITSRTRDCLCICSVSIGRALLYLRPVNVLGFTWIVTLTFGGKCLD